MSINIESYKAFLDKYDESKDFWTNHLLNVKIEPTWEPNDHKLGWFGKVVRWWHGDYRHTRVIPAILDIGREIARAYLKERGDKETLQTYLSKSIHLIDDYKTKVLKIHNDRRWFCKIKDKKITNLSGCLRDLIQDKSKEDSKGKSPLHASQTLSYDKLFLRVVPIDPQHQIMSMNSLSIDNYVGTLKSKELVSINWKGKVKFLQEILKSSKIAVLSKNHLINYNNKQLQVFLLAKNKNIFTYSVQNPFKFADLKVINDHQFLVLESAKNVAMHSLTMLDIRAFQPRKLFSSVTVPDFFVLPDKKRCLICNNSTVQIADLVGEKNQILYENKNLEDLPDKFFYYFHNEHYLILKYNTNEETNETTFGFWSLKSLKKICEFNQYYLLTMQSPYSCVGVSRDSKINKTIVISFNIENGGEEFLFETPLIINKLYPVSSMQYLYETYDHKSKEAGLYAWNIGDLNCTPLVESINGTTSFHVHKIKSDLWAFEKTLKSEEGKSLVFMKYNLKGSNPQIAPYPDLVDILIYNKRFLLISPKDKTKPQALLKISSPNPFLPELANFS